LDPIARASDRDFSCHVLAQVLHVPSTPVISVIETENHILMINAAYYLKLLALLVSGIACTRRLCFVPSLL
jgi:hypothetical protein